jgi:hypothetical protein
MSSSAERANQARSGIDYPVAIGLCVFALTHFIVLTLTAYIAVQADPSATPEQRRTAFGVSLPFIIGGSLVALGSHAAALAWTRRRFRYVALGMLLGLEALVAVLSAALILLLRETTEPGAELLIVLVGPANVTLATYWLVNVFKSRQR